MAAYIVLGTGIGIAILMGIASIVQGMLEERRRAARESAEKNKP